MVLTPPPERRPRPDFASAARTCPTGLAGLLRRDRRAAAEVQFREWRRRASRSGSATSRSTSRPRSRPGARSSASTGPADRRDLAGRRRAGAVSRSGSGSTHRIERPLFDFDHDGAMAPALHPPGRSSTPGSSTGPMAPRSSPGRWSTGTSSSRSTRSWAWPTASWSAAGSASPLVAMHYDFGSRTARAYQSSARRSTRSGSGSTPGTSTSSSPGARITAGRSTSRTARSTARATRRTGRPPARAIRAFESASNHFVPPRPAPGLVDESSPEPAQGGVRPARPRHRRGPGRAGPSPPGSRSRRSPTASRRSRTAGSTTPSSGG